MISLFRAFAWMRLRTAINTMRMGNRRGGFESLSRFLEATAPFLLVLILAPMALGLAVGAFFAGGYLAQHPFDSTAKEVRAIFIGLRVVAGVTLASVLISPLISSMKTGVSPSTVRLLLLPISKLRLYLVQVVGGIGDPVILGLVPAFLSLPLGVAVAGRWDSALATAAGGLLFLVVLLGLTSLAGLVLQLILRDRRRAERASMLIILLIVTVSILPVFFESWSNQGSIRISADGIPKMLQAALVLLPSELYVESLRFSLHLEAGNLLRALSMLALFAGGLLYLGMKLHIRMLESPEHVSRRRKQSRREGFRVPMPGLSPNAAAVARLQLRHVLRSVRGRMALVLTPLMIPVLGLVFTNNMRGLSWLANLFVPVIAVFMSQLTFQPYLLNAFGSDARGLQMLFLSPLSDAEVVKGKLYAGGLLVMAAAFLGLTGALFVSPPEPLWLWPVFLALAVLVYLVSGPISLIVSLYFPRASDLNSFGKTGNPHPTAGFVGFLLVGLVLSFPLSLVLGTYYLTHSALYTLILLVLASLLCAGVGYGVYRLALQSLAERREAVLMASSKR